VIQPAAAVTELRADDGVRLAAHRLGDPNAPAMVLVPGTFSNSTFWMGTRGVGFGRALAAHGYEAWSLDPRGHGRSQRPAAGERWDFDDWARLDVPAAVRAVNATGRKPVVIGHSAGGAAALAGLAADPALREAVRAAVIVATPLPWLQPMRGLFARSIRAISHHLDRFPARLLRLGPEDELPGVMTQWMSWNIEGNWTGDDGTDYGSRLADLDLPAFVIAAAGDRMWAPPPAVMGLYERIGSPDKSFLVCGRRSGYSRDFDHVDVLIGRPARTEVWPLILNWLAHLS
jgi:predicted alpha/beta hydrolase